MKSIKLLLLAMLISSRAYSQSISELINGSLTVEQCKSLDSKFEKEREGKDFKDLKVAFFSGSGGSVQRMSSDFFEYPLSIPATIFFFSQKDKEKHGYDCIIGYMCKNLPIKNNTKRLKKLSRKKPTIF